MTTTIKLVDQIRSVMRLKHYALRTEKTYLVWIKQYVAFHTMVYTHVMHKGTGAVKSPLDRMA